ncbi:hypothetical protein BDF20DRAFT_843185 [Mycotypha africana]|uniref:uncharacterized protein n=1 Tax=Mycotypha africana TaxID=64632 RepID=UPI002301444C|nr:uncharacterized protein BDF20DRAFT_843185 [Mycotypha africana]KAI8991187.1 hypothetical protein BDF20DRAFT_843185 [Mycotypha africana]
MSSITPAYNTNFPALFSTGGSSSFNQQRRKSAHSFSNHLPPPGYQRSLAPPKVPSYLKQTMYGTLAYEQYKYYQCKHDIKPLPSASSGNSSHDRQRTPTATPTNMSKSLEQHWENLDLRLPSCWNAMDKSKNIEIGKNGLDLLYIGPGKQETHAALARTNFPMRPQCGVYYFEMTVLSKGNDGYIGIGFCSATNKLERLPGWDPDSWGYHGDDGHSFAGSGTGKNYGPCFTTNDTIGCGVNFADNSAFYTKNGKFLGYAFHNMDFGGKEMYPAVGLRTAGERVTVNFGQETFKFDIDQYVYDQRLRFIGEITMKNRYDGLFQKRVMDQLVLSYLIHQGYSGTAKAVIQDVNHISGEKLQLFEDRENEIIDSHDVSLIEYMEEDDDNASNCIQQQKSFSRFREKDMEERQRIRAAIIAGKIDEAIHLMEAYYPGVLQQEGRGKDLQLWLKCGKFVEMMREFCESQRLSLLKSDDSKGEMMEGHENTNTLQKGCNLPKIKRSSSLDNHSPTPQPVTGKRRLSYAAIAASPQSEIPPQPQPTTSTDSMDIDRQSVDNNGSVNLADSTSQFLSDSYAWTKRRTSISNLLNHNGTTHPLDSGAKSASSNSLEKDNPFIVNHAINNKEGNAELNAANNDNASQWKKLLEYGQQLSEEYRYDSRTKTKSYLMEIFSLLAYPDPYASPVAHLMNVSRRDALATEVNAAILAYQNRPEMPALDRILRQIILTSKELAFKGDGKAALMNLEEYCAHDVEINKSINNNPTSIMNNTTNTVTSYF